ncbi:MAG: hypothetical protein LBD67_02325 [Candidatus Accumulibacter sp.]|jgi:hypothetical protein|nr:hypothetical protein [Accumulibacter sp.]
MASSSPPRFQQKQLGVTAKRRNMNPPENIPKEVWAGWRTTPLLVIFSGRLEKTM